MSKHVLYDVHEVHERMLHEFTKGMNALDWLESEIRSVLDALTGSPLTGSPQSRPRRKPAPPLPLTAEDQRAADQIAQDLAGGKPKK